MSDENKKQDVQEEPEVQPTDSASSPEQEASEEAGTSEKRFAENPADVIEDKTREAARKTSEIAHQVLEKLKTGLNQAIAVSNRVIGEVSASANHYAEQYKNSAEISRLSSQKEMVIQELGQEFFALYEEKAAVPEKLIAGTSLQTLFDRISTINDEIIRIGNLLEANKQERK